MTGFPKLNALLKQASDRFTTSDLSTLLHLPETEEKSKEVAQALTDFNAKNLIRSNTATNHDIGDIDPVDKGHPRALTKSTLLPKLERLKQSQDCLLSLFDALNQNICTLNCAYCHVAKLQIRYPEGSSESSDSVQHKIYVSCCLVQDKWQETTCKVLCQP